VSTPSETLPPPPDAPITGEPLPPHTDRCMGCGPDAVAGYHLTAYPLDGDVIATYAFGAAHEGGPKLAHGGAVAALCDDLLGHLLRVHAFQGVTRHLAVDYHRPVLIGERHRLRASLSSVDGRKLWAACAAYGDDGEVRFAARALFVRVGVEHFLAGLSDDERNRAEAWLAEQREKGEDPTVW
jgi:acyl-CoA thioesterase FadM